MARIDRARRRARSPRQRSSSRSPECSRSPFSALRSRRGALLASGGGPFTDRSSRRPTSPTASSTTSASWPDRSSPGVLLAADEPRGRPRGAAAVSSAGSAVLLATPLRPDVLTSYAAEDETTAASCGRRRAAPPALLADPRLASGRRRPSPCSSSSRAPRTCSSSSSRSTCSGSATRQRRLSQRGLGCGRVARRRGVLPCSSPAAGSAQGCWSAASSPGPGDRAPGRPGRPGGRLSGPGRRSEPGTRSSRSSRGRCSECSAYDETLARALRLPRNLAVCGDGARIDRGAGDDRAAGQRGGTDRDWPPCCRSVRAAALPRASLTRDRRAGRRAPLRAPAHTTRSSPRCPSRCSRGSPTAWCRSRPRRGRRSSCREIPASTST